MAEGLRGQVRLCEQFLRRSPLSDEQLKAMSLDQLNEIVNQLRNVVARESERSTPSTLRP